MMYEISELAKVQFFQCMVMSGGGIITVILYKIVEFMQINICESRLSKAILEIIFWVIAAWIFGDFLYYCSFGELGFHSIIAFIMGMGIGGWSLKKIRKRTSWHND